MDRLGACDGSPAGLFRHREQMGEEEQKEEATQDAHSKRREREAPEVVLLGRRGGRILRHLAYDYRHEQKRGLVNLPVLASGVQKQHTQRDVIIR